MTTDLGQMDRRAAVRELFAERGSLLVVTGLGSPSYDAFAAGDSDGNFYLWGAMGVPAWLASASPWRDPTVRSACSPAMASSSWASAVS